MEDRRKVLPPPKTVLECMMCPYNKRGLKTLSQTIHHFCIALDTMANDFGKFGGLISEFSAAMDTWGQTEIKEQIEILKQEIDELGK